MLSRRLIALSLLLLIVVLTAVALRTRPRSAGGRRQQGCSAPGNVRQLARGYAFGLVEVDTLLRRITFPARVDRDSGRVLTLVNLTGYYWLDDSVAITSSARLLDLQQAIASLDWRFYDSLWTGLNPKQKAWVSFAIPGQISRLPGLLADSLLLIDGVFLGAPESDGVALHSHAGVDSLAAAGRRRACATCPALRYEQQAVLAAMRRRTDKPGFELSPTAFLKRDTEINVIVQLP